MKCKNCDRSIEPCGCDWGFFHSGDGLHECSPAQDTYAQPVENKRVTPLLLNNDYAHPIGTAVIRDDQVELVITDPTVYKSIFPDTTYGLSIQPVQKTDKDSDKT